MDTRLTLAYKYYESGLPADAWSALQDVLASPSPGLATLQLAAVLRFDARDLDEALRYSEKALALAPQDAQALLIKGLVLLDRDRAEEAAAALGAAAEAAPGAAPVHFSHGLALHRRGRLVEAEAAYRRALALQSPYAIGWNNLGIVLDDMGRSGEAIAAFDRAIAEQPGLAVAHSNRGAALAGQGRFAAAAAAQRRALECDPANAGARVNLGVALLEQGDAKGAVAAFDAVLAADPANKDAADNRLYAMHYVEADPGALHKLHAGWGKGAGAAASAPAAAARAGTPLRVGYVSADFRRHSVSFFTEPLLANHNPAAVEVFAYADLLNPDDVTARLKTHVRHWRDITGLPDGHVRDLIAGDCLDVLVDLSGHTVGNRLGVFARRAAPAQVTALGYPGTTGLGAMDARLCDGITDPAPEADAWATEALVRLPSLHCYRPPSGAPAVTDPPAGKNGFITFGSFNKLAKISEACADLWAGALKAVPESRLLIKSKALAEEETRDVLAARFVARGIGRDRLDLRSWVPGDAGHLALYGMVDIALDTTPYNGTTTTCEALWMGVPVLTLRGRAHAGRVGASLLTSAGLTDWIAGTPEDFAAKAAAFACDMAALAGLRAGLRQKAAASRLCDGTAYARSVEAAYRKIRGIP